MRFLRWLSARLAGRWAVPAVIAVALVLTLPSVLSPYFIDEHVQSGKLKAARGGIGGVANEYFVFSSPDSNRHDMENTTGAWWTAPDFKVAFWRPLSAFTHILDHLLWPGSTVLMHVQGLLWLVVVLLALNALLRRFLLPGTATLALALFAWDDAHGMLVSWIANRHAVIAVAAGIFVVLAYDRWRRDGWRPGGWLTPILLAIGLLSSEMALASLGFLLGHALWIDVGPLRRRLARLLPSIGVVVLWQACYIAGGWGVAATGGYLNPLQEPFSYVVRLFERAPILLLGQLTPIPPDAWGMVPPAGRLVLVLLAVAVIAAVTVVAWPLVSRDRRARFWLLGAGVALALVCSTGPQERNLIFVGVGVWPVVAATFVAAMQRAPVAWWRRRFIATLAVCNLLLAPMFLPVKSLTILGLQKVFAATDATIPRTPDVGAKTLVVAWTALEPAVYYSSVRRDDEGVPRPGKVRVLAGSLGAVSVSRPDELSLRLRPRDGFFAGETSRMFRAASIHFRAGDVVELSNMRATVLEITADGRPQEVEFRFASPLESPEWIWMRGDRSGLVPWTPPKVGESSVIATAL